MASRAIEDMIDPVLTPPVRPKLEVDGKTRDSDDPVFRIECEDYLLSNKTDRSKKEK